MRPVCWNIITQIVKEYVRDTLIPTILLKHTHTFLHTFMCSPVEGPRRTETSHVLIKSLELKCHVHIFLLFIYIYNIVNWITNYSTK